MRSTRLSVYGWSLLGTALATGVTVPSAGVAPTAVPPVAVAPTAVPPVAVAPTGVPPLPTAPFVHAPLLGDPCREPGAPDPSRLREPGGPKRYFSVDGYLARALRITRGSAASARHHCITVAWPPGESNSAGKPTRVAKHIDAAWFKAIENTLERLPWRHIEVLQRFVIDDRPSLHGVAPYDRQSPDDARDGHTIWLHEHLFRDHNHWVRGNHGTYWGYHVNQDGVAFDGRGADHQLFSPVLLHEIGHTVMYHLVNPVAEAVNTPECAKTCADSPGGCEKLAPALRETGCISTYCMPFDFPGSTENWAELYRFHYQGSATRGLLGRAGAECSKVLAALDFDSLDPVTAPWERGLPDMTKFRPSRWKSCGDRACKPW
jgi:hypothetical protein